jgi:hypothetical protein
LLSAPIFISCPDSANEREKPLSYVARHVFTIHAAQGDASVPIELSGDLNATHPEITRAAIAFHGKGRNVEGYYSAFQKAL